MDLTEILWWSAGMFLLGILAGAAGMYRGQRKERSRELKKISDTVQRMTCLLYTSPSPRDGLLSRMPSSA